MGWYCYLQVGTLTKGLCTFFMMWLHVLPLVVLSIWSLLLIFGRGALRNTTLPNRNIAERESPFLWL